MDDKMMIIGVCVLILVIVIAFVMYKKKEGFVGSKTPVIGIFFTEDIVDLFIYHGLAQLASEISLNLQTKVQFNVGPVGPVLPHNWTSGQNTFNTSSVTSENISIHVYFPDTGKNFIINSAIVGNQTFPAQLSSLANMVAEKATIL